MDFLTREEYNNYLKDSASSKMELEANKYAFQRNLQGEYGKQILRDLSDTSNHYELKTSLFHRIKNWFRKLKEKRAYKKYAKREEEMAYLSIENYLKKKGGR